MENNEVLNNELLAKVLKQLEESNNINKQLLVAMNTMHAENKELQSDNKELREKLNLVNDPINQETLITEEQKTVLDINSESDIKTKAKNNIKNFRSTENLERKEPTFSEGILGNQELQENNRLEPIINENITQLPNIIEPKIITPKVDKIGKFKEMVASHFVTFTNKFDFIKENDYSLNNLGHKIQMQVKGILPEVSPFYHKMKDSFTEMAEDANVSIKNQINELTENIKENLNNKINSFTDRFLIVGKRSKINKMKRDFSKALNMVGFNPEELFNTEQKKDYYSIEEVNSTLNKSLASNINIQKINNEFIIPALENADDNLKAELVHKSIWPKFTKNLKEIIGLSLTLQNAKNNNKYMNILNDFAEKNNFTTEAVTHSLKTNPDDLKGCKNFGILMHNKDAILISEQKYEILTRNIFIVLQSLVKVGNHLETVVKELKIDDKMKNDIVTNLGNTNVADNQPQYTFSLIRKNVTNLLNNKEYIASIVESNNNQKLTLKSSNEEKTENSNNTIKLKR